MKSQHELTRNVDAQPDPRLDEFCFDSQFDFNNCKSVLFPPAFFPLVKRHSPHRGNFAYSTSRPARAGIHTIRFLIQSLIL